jgi:hypothetical protein
LLQLLNICFARLVHDLHTVALNQTAETTNVQKLHIAFFVKLALFKDALYVLGNQTSFQLKKLSDLLLSGQNRFIFKRCLDFGLALFGLITMIFKPIPLRFCKVLFLPPRIWLCRPTAC